MSASQLGRVASCLLAFACFSAFAKHPLANSDCRWPDETGAKSLNLNSASERRHLSEDAEFAEDLAIRYADSDGARGRDACMADLFRVIASTHKVSPDEVRRVLGHRRTSFDLAVILSFAALYGWAASIFVGWLYRVYGARENLTTLVIMTTFVSLLASTAGVMLGEIWSGILEALRIGNGHMSYRAARIPWTQHPLALFGAGVVLFLMVAAFRWLRGMKRDPGVSIC